MEEYKKSINEIFKAMREYTKGKETNINDVSFKIKINNLFFVISETLKVVVSSEEKELLKNTEEIQTSKKKDTLHNNDFFKIMQCVDILESQIMNLQCQVAENIHKYEETLNDTKKLVNISRKLNEIQNQIWPQCKNIEENLKKMENCVLKTKRFTRE
ncbi:Hypothetical protein SRAE_0000057200 [Strongyloides ratti]|uniref:Uncharacterized protein n=1 Tax=Strongyloides ratti TaxID=34506 RepID=A0A090MT06_STRRB|nr:Hypothetical protein SRAE_0000057200 [Strongyloides ratti]CEF61448.1 Hypothetical protein SRAE_0000057200 [Strongyloides ratti]